MTSIERLPARARAAYERGRLSAAARETLLIAPFIALALGRCTHVTLGCAAAVALVALLVALRWRGGAWGRSALIGALAGLPVLLLPALLPAVPGYGAGSSAVCAVVCPALGLFAGALLGSWGARQGAGRTQALAGGALVILTCGALGCATLWLSAIGGMWLGATVGGLAALRLARS